MDRNREARRASIVSSNGFNRRRHRTNSLRDSPDEDGGLELQESVRLRDRVKKDRDRERDRERERERDRERDLRERSSRSKRRRAERLTSNREDIGGDDTSEESVNDDEDEEEEENTTTAAAAGVRLLSPAVGSISNHHHHQHNHGHISNHHPSHGSSFSQQQHSSNSPSNIISSNNHHLQHRKTFPPSSSAAAKVFRAPPVWKAGDEMISVSVPRKARSASTKRSHDWISCSSNNNSGGGGGGVSGGDQILRQASNSPVRQGPVSTPAPLPAAPMSPSSSNASIRKKLKPSVNNSGPKLKPPKVASKPSSSNPEELEIEIAEVLYGLMTQSQAPSSKKEDSREINRSNSDAKSRNSSPISNSTSTNNPIISNSSPLSAVAPKRKRPRQVPENSSFGGRSAPVSAKPDSDQTPKREIASPNLDKISGSAAENGYEMGGNSVNAQAQPAEPPASTQPELAKIDTDLKPATEELRETRDLVAKEEMSSPKEKDSPAVRAEDSNNRDLPLIATASLPATVTKTNSMAPEMEKQKEEKFEIDLMAPPPQARSSSEREAKIDLRAVDQKPVLSIVDADLKAVAFKDKEDDKGKSGKDLSANVVVEEDKRKGRGEEAESHKEIEKKARNIDLQLDLERPERDGSSGVNANGNKSQLQNQKQQQQQQQQMPIKATREEPPTEKSGHSTSSLPLPMSMASWPGGLPQMGYMAPLQGVVSMDGTGAAVAPTHIQPLFSQPRPKRCATHCHIARNIHCLQQFMKMNSFWPAPAASPSLFGSKPCNLNVIPSPDLAVRGVNNAQDKGQSIASSSIPNHIGKDKNSQPATTPDSAQRKQQQILIQQALPPVASSNLLGPAFIFPLSQQQAAARPGAAKSPTTGAAPNTSTSAGTTAAAAAMSFNYPNMAANETQYLAFLQQNGCPFPIPTVGAPPNYRGAPAQAMPMFSGSFFSSQMIHPQIHQAQAPPSAHSQQQLHQNASASSGSSSSQKQHLQQQQQRAQNSGSGNAGNLQNFSQKTQPSQQQLQQSHNQYAQHQSRTRHHEGEMATEDSPSTTDNSRGSRASMNIYGQNFPMPIHPQNFALMTPPAALASAAAAAAANSSQNEKKSHQSQQQGLKNGVDSLPQNSFAMSFSPINGSNAGQGIDIASMAQNHAMFQNSSEATRQNIQMMAAVAAQAAAQKKNFRISEDAKSGGVDSSATDDERKILAGKALGGVGQSIAFTRSELPDAAIQGNNVIESSARPLSAPARSSRPMTTNTVGAINVSNPHIHAQLQQQQMLQLKHQHQHQHQQQQQQQQQMAANRSKVPVTSNGSIYSEQHLNASSAMAAKFQNPLTGFPQNLVQSNNNSPSQSPQWKNSTRTTPTSQATSTVKNLPQQHNSRSQPQIHTHISFGGNQKPSAPSQGQAPPPSSSNQVGSPTTSSISKGAGGSPRTSTSATTNNKTGQASSFSPQPPKNSPSMPNQKSPSILGNPNAKNQMQQQQSQQQQIQKNMQQQQLFFPNTYTQSQSPHSTNTSSTNSGPTGYYMQQRRQGGPVACSTGVLSLCPPVTLGNNGGTTTNDPAKAIAAATCNGKSGGLPSQGIIQASQFAAAQSGGTLLPAGYSYVHPVPAAVQVKPAEQKQPAGNDNLHTWQPDKK